MSFPNLESERLLFRRFTESDVESFVAYRSDPEVARYQSWDNYSIEDGRRFITEMASQEFDLPGTWIQIALEKKESGELIGDLAVHTLEPDGNQIEIGFTLARVHQGKGFAKESLKCLLDFMFRDLNKHRVIAICDAKNDGAAKLLRSLEFRQEAHLIQNIWFKGAWGDEFQYAMLQDEWLALPTDL
jgi:RimJ/RimL family protein N-acetyltransferase